MTDEVAPLTPYETIMRQARDMYRAPQLPPTTDPNVPWYTNMLRGLMLGSQTLLGPRSSIIPPRMAVAPRDSIPTITGGRSNAPFGSADIAENNLNVQRPEGQNIAPIPRPPAANSNEPLTPTVLPQTTNLENVSDLLAALRDARAQGRRNDFSVIPGGRDVRPIIPGDPVPTPVNENTQIPGLRATFGDQTTPPITETPQTPHQNFSIIPGGREHPNSVVNSIVNWLVDAGVPIRRIKEAESSGTHYIHTRDPSGQRVQIRVPIDNHTADPIRSQGQVGNLFDLGEGRLTQNPNRNTTRNVSGEPYSHLPTLFQSLLARLNPPNRNWLVPPGTEPVFRRPNENQAITDALKRDPNQGELPLVPPERGNEHGHHYITGFGDSNVLGSGINNFSPGQYIRSAIENLGLGGERGRPTRRLPPDQTTVVPQRFGGPDPNTNWIVPNPALQHSIAHQRLLPYHDQIVQFHRQGFTNAAIAQALGLSHYGSAPSQIGQYLRQNKLTPNTNR